MKKHLSSGNMQTKGPNVKKKRSDSNHCHQCYRSHKETLSRCTKCRLKIYCIPWITKRYTRMDETDFVEACPICDSICNCAACLLSDVANKDLPIPDVKLSTTDKIQHSKDIVRVLLPSMKRFVVEENMEREEAARTQGLAITALQLPAANFSHNDKVKCNNCKTSIFHIHRSCLNCFYKLCVTCCQENRDDSQLGNGLYHEHDVGCNFTTKDGSSKATSCFMGYTKLVSEWKLKEKGTTVCPTEGMGGCGRGNLEFKSTYPDNWVSQLVMKAEAFAEVGKVIDALEASEGACSCLRSNQGSELEYAMLLASGEESNDNYLHCPAVLDAEKNDLKHFQWHLYKGEPVIVPNVLSGMTRLSWEPLVMGHACRKPRKTSHLHIQNFRVLNSLNWCEELTCTSFLLDVLSPSLTVKVGLKLPEMSLKPDLGPKMCVYRVY